MLTIDVAVRSSSIHHTTTAPSGSRSCAVAVPLLRANGTVLLCQVMIASALSFEYQISAQLVTRAIRYRRYVDSVLCPIFDSCIARAASQMHSKKWAAERTAQLTISQTSALKGPSSPLLISVSCHTCSGLSSSILFSHKSGLLLGISRSLRGLILQ
ncbi:hypothetical protein BDZ45DRAFT_411801 [Acephala macrosclerotiorum]|nr:hypothetical protein BDZ45DRAFT_411801 [Acephala macrosclerotiorum]